MSYDAGDRLVQETVITSRGDIYQIAYEWDGAGNMRQKVVSGPRGDTDTEFHWTAENRLTRVDGDSSIFNNLPLLEGEGKDQNTWAALRSSSYDQNREERLVYDHLGLHILARQRPSDGLLHETYVVGPNRDELLAYKKNADRNTPDRAYVYGNFRNDVLAVRSADDPRLAEDRTYLPTGVALTAARQNIRTGPPPNAPLPPNFPSNVLPRPLMFGWQGKMHQQGVIDFNNRFLSPNNQKFTSVDPIIMESVDHSSPYVAMGNNSMRFSDPTGLYSVEDTSNWSNTTYYRAEVCIIWFNWTKGFYTICKKITKSKTTHYKPSVYAAMNKIKYFLNYYCVNNSDDLRSDLKSKYAGAYVLKARKPLEGYLLQQGQHTDAVAVTGPGSNTTYLDPVAVASQAQSADTQDDIFTSTIFHEMIHAVGASGECRPYVCQNKCGSYFHNADVHPATWLQRNCPVAWRSGCQ